MANIIFPKPWEQNGLKPTEESTYNNRRQIIKKLGLASIGVMASPMLLANCTGKKPAGEVAATAQKALQDNNFTFPGMLDLYPAKRNERYKIERPLTEEYDATHYNNFYEFIHPKDSNIYNVYKYVDDFDTRDWSFEVKGMAKNTGKYDLADIMKKIQLEERTYRFRCVERWSMNVPWTGFSLASLIKMLEPDSKAKYIRMRSHSDKNQMPGVKNQPWYPWPYFEGLKIEEAMNELAFMATGLYGKPLPKQNGAPMRLVVPWKYGYKNIKSVVELEFTDKEPETFWHKLQPAEYPFISNVNPEVPHPRWSQAREKSIPDGDWRPTSKYNGYGEFVAKLYE
ncbi:protein-methionine-sulfoxide reductase catalytic subunit MsrP [Flammeovirgaceae bacterium SG7u.111]|nr:protein-methionine-sulfoxide reductase catalytic subunit MsrP [Flammeovirgaceae bacterium SG7u.132]WPO34521.1 protein-methionine-sulfoxide reductase catalytic subunit MsrP [Flammeovirgaceae bacterium SG7u.111]